MADIAEPSAGLMTALGLRTERLIRALDHHGRAGADPALVTGLLGLRICLIGNMNNKFFAMTRYFRDMGLEADLLLFPVEADHFRPECDSYDRDWIGFVRSIAWDDIVHADRETLYREIAGYDMILGCGTAPAYLGKIGLPLDIFSPYGSDIYEIPRLWADDEDYRISRNLDRYALGKWQRAGLAATRRIFANNENQLRFAADLRLDVPIELCRAPAVYAPAYDPAPLARARADSPHAAAFSRIRRENTLVIFHHARHIWKNAPDEQSWKGNDKLLRGFAGFLEAHPGLSACLVCFEYGPDVEASRTLCRELGIAGRVAWMPLMPRKDIMIGIEQCDIGTGYFSVGWTSGGVIYEIMIMGKPLLHYIGDYSEADRPQGLFPFIPAGTAEEVAAALADYVRRPQYYADMGERGRQWYQREVVDRSLGRYLDILIGTVQERLGDRRAAECRIGALEERNAALTLALTEAQTRAERADLFASRLFGDRLPTEYPADFTWYVRAGALARTIFGNRPLDAIPPMVARQIKSLLWLYDDGRGDATPTRPLAETLLEQDPATIAAMIAEQQRLGPWHGLLVAIVRRGGWRSRLLGRVLRWLAGSTAAANRDPDRKAVLQRLAPGELGK